MSTDAGELLIDDDAIDIAIERACAVMHHSWCHMDPATRENARLHMRPRIVAAAVVFEELIRLKLGGVHET